MLVVARLGLNAQPTARSLQSAMRELVDQVLPPDTVMPDGQLPMRTLFAPVKRVVVVTATGNAGFAPVSCMLVPVESTIPVLVYVKPEATNRPVAPPQPNCKALHFAMRFARVV